MLKNDYTRAHADWNLERSLELIGSKFEDYIIIGVKCCRMKDHERSARYCNFINYKDDELVKYRDDFDALQHLEQLICNLKKEIEFNSDLESVCNNFKIGNLKDLVLLGFSKGGAVLNQIMISLYELKNDLDKSSIRKQENQINSSNHQSNDNLDDTFGSSYLSSSISNSMMNFGSNYSMTNSLSTSFTDNKMFFDILNDAVNQRLNTFYKKLSKIIWLDLGCMAVDDNVYIRDDKVLKNIVDLEIELQVHCTPYQVNCSLRPYIGRQEREFSDKLKELNANYKSKLYFKNETSSISNHFKLLKEFDLL